MIYTLLLGSNVEPRAKYLRGAIELIEKHGKIVGASSVQETKAWGNTDQDDFLNQVVLLESDLSARELLVAIHVIEQSLGRIREEKWGPRTIDIDILYAEDQIIDEQDLSIPHPLIPEREFTLELLNEIASDFVNPKTGKSAGEMLEDLALTQ